MIRKNITLKQVLMQSFHFVYAGICSVDIVSSGKKYTVVTRGFTIDEDNIVFFNENKTVRKSYDDLYNAVRIFNELVNKITSTCDWFSKDFFELENIKSRLNKHYVY